MLEKIKNINPREITDFAQMQSMLIMFMNIIESQSSLLEAQSKEIQELKKEINRLKGEHGDLPPRPPKSLNNTTINLPKAKVSKNKNHKKGGKKAKLIIDRTVKCEIDKSILPADAKFLGYDTLVQQDLIIKRENVLFQVPVYYSSRNKQTYRGELPSCYEGQFGGQLKSWLQLLHHYGDVTQGRMKKLMDNLGIQISTGSINNILLSNTDVMVEESADILRAGIEYLPYTQSDGTKGWEAGQGKSTQVICSPYYSVYHTMDSKSKANIIWALQGKQGNSIPLIYNQLAIDLLADSIVPQKDQKLIGHLLKLGQEENLESFETLLSGHAPHLMTKVSYPKVLECLSLAYYLTQTNFPRISTLVSDAGPEYVGIAIRQALCWLHEERHYKKMIPKLNVNKIAVEKIRGEIWDLYEKLLEFKELTADQQKIRKPILEKLFDKIFKQQTDYEHLNDRLEKTFSKKRKLLLVLDFPDTPLHNNAAELAVRRKVRKRDISLHTMSAKGTQAQDAFMSVIETAAKLGVNALDYLYDRITKKYLMPSLAETIKGKTLPF